MFRTNSIDLVLLFAVVMVNLIGICIAASLWSGVYIQNDIVPEVISASWEYDEKMEQLKGKQSLF